MDSSWVTIVIDSWADAFYGIFEVEIEAAGWEVKGFA